MNSSGSNLRSSWDSNQTLDFNASFDSSVPASRKKKKHDKILSALGGKPNCPQHWQDILNLVSTLSLNAQLLEAMRRGLIGQPRYYVASQYAEHIERLQANTLFQASKRLSQLESLPCEPTKNELERTSLVLAQLAVSWELHDWQAPEACQDWIPIWAYEVSERLKKTLLFRVLVNQVARGTTWTFVCDLEQPKFLIKGLGCQQLLTDAFYALNVSIKEATTDELLHLGVRDRPPKSKERGTQTFRQEPQEFDYESEELDQHDRSSDPGSPWMW